MEPSFFIHNANCYYLHMAKFTDGEWWRCNHPSRKKEESPRCNSNDCPYNTFPVESQEANGSREVCEGPTAQSNRTQREAVVDEEPVEKEWIGIPMQIVAKYLSDPLAPKEIRDAWEKVYHKAWEPNPIKEE